MQSLLRNMIFVIGMMFMPIAASAQGQTVPGSAILIIDSERLYTDSLFGQRANAELQAETAVLAAEYRRIEAELIEEEQELTRKRPEMTPEDFRKSANAFDARVRTIREVQQQREITLIRASDEEKQRFFAQLKPVLEVVLRESGAVVVFEKRSVFASSLSLDVTDRVIARADEMLGDGRLPGSDDIDDAANQEN